MSNVTDSDGPWNAAGGRNVAFSVVVADSMSRECAQIDTIASTWCWP